MWLWAMSNRRYGSLAGWLSRNVLWGAEEEVVCKLAYMTHILHSSQGAIVDSRGSAGGSQDLVHSLWLDLYIKVCVSGKIETVGHSQNEGREGEEEEEEEGRKRTEEETAEVQRDNCEGARGVEGRRVA